MKPTFVLLFLALTAATSAAAQTDTSAGSDFVSGFLKPLLSLDHVAAMVAVGLWAAILGAPGKWVLPIAFPLVMALGGALGANGINLPWIDTGIAASALVIGLAIALDLRPPMAAAAAIVAAFAVFHGHAHGTEMPLSSDPLSYGVGVLIGTGLLHLAGIALGQLAVTAPGKLAVRAMGLAIALGGLAFLTGIM